MITENTVLVLGAGTSNPYGYPTGKRLKDEIIKRTLEKEMIQLYAQFDTNVNELEQFIKALQKSAKPSIDAFLEHRSEFTEIGKIAITEALIKYEDEELLFNNDDWYQYLFNKLSTEFDEFDKNKLSVITFNYDRSLEHFLLTALKNSYGKSEETCVKKLLSIPIIHVYGQIGPLPWQGGNFFRSYSPEYKILGLKESSNGIRILHETGVASDHIFANAQKLLGQAKNIYFLGFGYHKINLLRLGLSNLDESARVIIGSSHGLAGQERRDIENYSKEKIKLVDPGNRKVLDFMQEYISFN